MHFIKPRLDRATSRILVAVSFAAGFAAASCSSGDRDGSNPTDAGSEPANGDAAALANGDAGAGSPDGLDAQSADVSPLPVVCESQPCVTSLVTTLGAGIDDRSEGFCALLSDGTVACWGANGAGQLGRGEDAGTVDSSKAERVHALSDAVMLDHTCALDKSGAIWCWGTGPFSTHAPEDAGAEMTARAPVKLDLPPATKVGLGHTTACAEVSDGLVCWGSNADAQLGPLTADAGLPRRISIPQGASIRTIAVGRATFVLHEDGTLVTWGANPTVGRVTPFFPDPYPQTVDVGGILAVDLAYDDACATARGLGYCWGAPVVSSHGSVVDRALPEPVVTPEPIVQIATTHTYAIENIGIARSRWCASAVSGAVYCWGFNQSGQAGDGTQSYAYDAVRVEGLPGPAAQVKTTPNTTCALLTNGKVYCWGSNYNGQLGNGENRGRSFVPLEVMLP